MLKLPADRKKWPSMILAAFYTQHPEIVVEDAKVVIDDRGQEVMWGAVYFTVGGKRFAAPFVVRSNLLYPLDVLLLPTGELKAFVPEAIQSQMSVGQPTSKAPKSPETKLTPTSARHLPLPVALSRMQVVKLGSEQAWIRKHARRYKVAFIKNGQIVSETRWSTKHETEDLLKKLGYYVDEAILKKGGITVPVDAIKPYRLTSVFPMRDFEGNKDITREVTSFLKVAENVTGSFLIDEMLTEPLRILSINGDVYTATTTTGKPVLIKKAEKFKIAAGPRETVLLLPDNAKFVKTARIAGTALIKGHDALYLAEGEYVRPLEDDELLSKVAALGYVGELAEDLKTMLEDAEPGLAVVFDEPRTMPLKKIAQQLELADRMLAAKLLKILQESTPPEIVASALDELETELAKLLLKYETVESTVDIDTLRQALYSIAKLKNQLHTEAMLTHAPGSQSVEGSAGKI